MTRGDQTTAFATRLLELIERTRTNSTYKYAVLLGLVEVCQERFSDDGFAPEMVTTRQLAAAVLENYWRQVREHPRFGELLQNNGGQARIVSRIDEFKRNHPQVPSPYVARRAHPKDYVRLLNDVEWILIKAPLPRLQRVGDLEREFLYTIHWEVADVRKQKRASGVSAYQRQFGPEKVGDEIVCEEGFDNRILLKPNVGDHLVRLAPLVRPLIRRRWTGMVAKLNELQSDELERFLFRAERSALHELAEPLKETQDGDCFYCGRGMRGTEVVDHFIAWSRHPNDDVFNLVAAHEECNQEKAHHLAASDHLENWSQRFTDESRDIFGELGREHGLPAEPATSLAIGRSTYLPLPSGTPLWLRGTSEFEPADPDELHSILQSIRVT